MIKPISILIAEDHTIIRQGFHMMLQLEPDFKVVGGAKNGRETIAMAIELQPDVILMDIAMPGLNGLEATKQLIKLKPTTRIIILTAHCDDAYVNSAVDSGAMGFLLKQDSIDHVCQAIRDVAQGKIFYSTSISKRFVHLNPLVRDRSGKKTRSASVLTSREMEVLQLIAEGKANKETAAELGISIKTVEKHRGHLMEKLDIHDTAGLTRHAIASGIIESSVQVTML